jgi:hypothetical protein
MYNLFFCTANVRRKKIDALLSSPFEAQISLVKFFNQRCWSVELGPQVKALFKMVWK